MLVVAGIDEDAVFVVVDGVSDRERDREAATMMGGVASNADENSPDKLRKRLIVEAAIGRHAAWKT